MVDQNPYATPSADVAVEELGEEVLAGRFARLIAAIVDGIVILLVLVPFTYLFGYWERALSGQYLLLEGIAWTVAGTVVWLVVNGYTLAKRGQTLGKMLLGVRIVSVSDDSILPVWKVFFVRYLPVTLVSQIPLLGFFAVIINALFIFRADRRCVHDLMAGSRVVKA